MSLMLKMRPNRLFVFDLPINNLPFSVNENKETVILTAQFVSNKESEYLSFGQEKLSEVRIFM